MRCGWAPEGHHNPDELRRVRTGLGSHTIYIPQVCYRGGLPTNAAQESEDSRNRQVFCPGRIWSRPSPASFRFSFRIRYSRRLPGCIFGLGQPLPYALFSSENFYCMTITRSIHRSALNSSASTLTVCQTVRASLADAHIHRLSQDRNLGMCCLSVVQAVLTQGARRRVHHCTHPFRDFPAYCARRAA